MIRTREPVAPDLLFCIVSDLGQVDLRWGIPEEKSETGETLHICLDYIGKCRPYFIGMLGERYGGVFLVDWEGSYDHKHTGEMSSMRLGTDVHWHDT